YRLNKLNLSEKQKMEKQEQIPVLKPSELNEFHFKNIKWNPTISQTKHNSYHINRLEDYVLELNFPLPPHRKTLHDFIYLKKGTSKRSKGLNKYHFKAAEIFFLPAFQITEHEAMSKDTQGIYIHFDDQIFSFLPKNYLNDHYTFFQTQSNPILHISKDTQDQIEHILDRIMVFYENENEISTNIIASYLLSIFEEIKKDQPAEQKKIKNAFTQITELYKNALAQNIYQKQSITEYAHILNISPNYLNKCVKNSINRTAQDLLNEMLILEAKNLLKFSNLQIAEIAANLCDQTPSNFSRFFKKQTGITPKDYLKMY
ncbi:MAG: helix-turn-helix domain-containing protein, partial [Bacteroidota bacterium]